MALKRQQAVEDAIALRLAYNETGSSMEVLPPGKIFGMSVTNPCASPAATAQPSPATTGNGGSSSAASTAPCDTDVRSLLKQRTADRIPSGHAQITLLIAAQHHSETVVSSNAIDMLVQLFPHRKRSVLELILRRCDLDLLRAIEQCHPPMQSQSHDGRLDSCVSSTSAQRAAAANGADTPTSSEGAGDRLEPIVVSSAFRPPTSLTNPADTFSAYSTQQVSVRTKPTKIPTSLRKLEHAAHVIGVYWFHYATHTHIKQNKLCLH